jgi:hypothetical protein
MRYAHSPLLAVSNDASPKGWSQKWAHELSMTANRSEKCTSRLFPSLPWAQEVVDSRTTSPGALGRASEAESE